MTYPLILILAALLGLALLVGRACARWVRMEVVHEGHVGLLYLRGRYLRPLQPGGHWLLGPGRAVAHVDLRNQVITVPGQEILTADEVSVKVSVASVVRVVDAAVARHAAAQWMAELYMVIQLAVRDEIAAVEVEEIRARRVQLGQALAARVRAGTEHLGIEVASAEIKDVMLPGEVKAAFTRVLAARKEGQAALEVARGQSAVVRSLANAAKLMERHPGLAQLRLLESLDHASKGSGNTLVLGVPTELMKIEGAKS